MRIYLKLFFVLTLFFNSANLLAENSYNSILSYQFLFQKDENFLVEFADYSKGDEEFFELNFEQNSPLPPEIHTNKTGLMISGNNHSDDLFMYTYKKINGLKPNTTYKAHFSLVLATNASANCFGVGGSSGSSVYVKTGLVVDKPQRYLDEHKNYRMALDKGNQDLDGTDMILLGHLGVDTEDCIDWYSLKSLTNDHKDFIFQSNESGNAWVIIGTDSGYEATTKVYYTSLTLNLVEIK